MALPVASGRSGVTAGAVGSAPSLFQSLRRAWPAYVVLGCTLLLTFGAWRYALRTVRADEQGQGVERRLRCPEQADGRGDRPGLERRLVRPDLRVEVTALEHGARRGRVSRLIRVPRRLEEGGQTEHEEQRHPPGEGARPAEGGHRPHIITG